MLIRGQSLPNDSESLQADVMRFLAIIAFCLIAILALVRSVDPAPETPPPAAQTAAPPTAKAVAVPEPEPTPRTPPQAVSAVESEPAVTAAGSVPYEPEKAPPASDVWVVTRAPEESLPATPEVAQAKEELPLPAYSSEATAPEPAADVPAADAPSAEEEGLTLRFASDSDFLRLVARGEIVVYAFSNADVLRLDDRYRFADSTAPGQVYELLPGSVPSLISDALRQARSDAASYHWGIALPSRIRQRIEQLVQSVNRGQLVIDRFGEVHHVAAS